MKNKARFLSLYCEHNKFSAAGPLIILGIENYAFRWTRITDS